MSESEIETLRAQLAQAESRYTALVSHLQGPTGWRIDRPGLYEIFIRVFPEGGGFITSLERTELDAPVAVDAAWPSKNWRTFHEICGRAEAAEKALAASHEVIDMLVARLGRLREIGRIGIRRLLKFSWEGSSVNYPARTALNEIQAVTPDGEDLIDEVRREQLVPP